MNIDVDTQLNRLSYEEGGQTKEFSLAQSECPFNESTLDKCITDWPDDWLKRIG